jgi:hypothetical protein
LRRTWVRCISFVLSGTSMRRSFEIGFVNVGRPTWPSNLSTEAKSGSRVMTST